MDGSILNDDLDRGMREIDEGLNQEIEVTIGEEREVPCEFITGVAGSGKTYQVKKAVADDSSYGVLCSTTGVSAVNLGAITVHSLLRYSTTQVLKDSWLQGKLTRILHQIGKRSRRLMVDEISMGSAHQLDTWYRAVKEVNRYSDMEEPMGITLVGDLLQLPPVNEPWCFDAECWPEFREHTTRLTKVWRQDSSGLVDALNLVRAGNGVEAAKALTDLGVKWNTQLDTEFDGTSIFSMNDKVSRYNQIGLDRVKGQEFIITSSRWGQQQPEWGFNTRTKEWGIPQQARFKTGAYVMVLSNAADFHYVNGDCGWIREHDQDSITIELVRTGEEIELPKICRGVEFIDRPEGWNGQNIPKEEDNGGYRPRTHHRGRVKRYVMGQVEYFPMRLAYASTVHKSQSLTLDRVQVDFRDWFFGKPGMLYVALSRARTLEGLRLVGQPEKFAHQCAVDPRVREWI